MASVGAVLAWGSTVRAGRLDRRGGLRRLLCVGTGLMLKARMRSDCMRAPNSTRSARAVGGADPAQVDDGVVGPPEVPQAGRLRSPSRRCRRRTRRRRLRPSGRLGTPQPPPDTFIQSSSPAAQASASALTSTTVFRLGPLTPPDTLSAVARFWISVRAPLRAERAALSSCSGARAPGGDRRSIPRPSLRGQRPGTPPKSAVDLKRA